ncbi:MAG: bacteriohopanetetrol glucosamine biosynthesis glycosyltransferase HpnI [Acidobacteriota bacterium]|nr:bacteriohopanetetrol glucosamine biosynthesis glycosyltransferase HpnI [Acidobacteriota bacterium]
MQSYFYIAPLMALFAGSIVYCAIAVAAALNYRRFDTPKLTRFPAISVLRPLSGAQDNTEENLRSVFNQAYPHFEVLLSVHEESDPAAEIAHRVMAEYSGVPSRLVIAGPSPLPNAKVWSLRALISEARYETVVMSDSDIRLESDCLTTVVSELSMPGVGLVTCPYRAVGGPKYWPRVEAFGLNTEFLAGMLTQRYLNGMDFAIGCTVATRRSELEAIGGLRHLQRYLAEDFMMGNLMHAHGRQVILSRSVIEHHIGNDGFAQNWKHRLRWARSTRRSRRIGYLGEIFTKPVSLSLLVTAAAPRAWWCIALALIARWVLARATARRILSIRRIWLVPVEDLASFLTWLLGFFGKTILWRGRKLVVARDGSFEI